MVSGLVNVPDEIHLPHLPGKGRGRVCHLMAAVPGFEVKGVPHSISICGNRRLLLPIFRPSLPAHAEGGPCLVSQFPIPRGVDVKFTFHFIDQIADTVPAPAEGYAVSFFFTFIDARIQKQCNTSLLVNHIKKHRVRKCSPVIAAAPVILKHAHPDFFRQAALPGINGRIQTQVTGSVDADADFTGSVSPRNTPVVDQYDA